MKPKGTDIRKREQKRAAVKSVLFSGLFRILGAALLLFTREHTPWPELHGLLLLLAILDLQFRCADPADSGNREGGAG